ncbi:MAG: hypothetical protein NVSMB66_3980 [Candidatus Doudnabacteria bacterium]
MTSKEKKQYAILAFLALATFGVIYFNFLKPKKAPAVYTVALPGTPPGGTGMPPVTPGTAASSPTSPTTSAGAAIQKAGSGPAFTNSAGAILPNGNDLRLDVLRSKPFSDFVEPNYPQVKKEEIGSTDLFGK